MDCTPFRQFDELIKRSFRPTSEPPVRRREAQLLTLIQKEPNKPLHFYARHVHLERGSFTYLCENLEMRGLVQRTVDADDRRKKSLELTKEGNRLVESLNADMEHHMKTILEVFTKDEQKELKQALETVQKLLPKLPHLEHPQHGHHGGPPPHED